MPCGLSQLKNIQFKSLSVMVLSIEHTSRVLIRWQLVPTAQNLQNLKFFIDRSEAPNEYRQLNTDGISAYDLYEYVDYTANLLDLNRMYFYRVRAVEIVDGAPQQTFTSAETTWDGDLDTTGLFIVEEHEFEHRWVDGVPSMIFKKRHEGVYCPRCWDRILKRVTQSNCTACYGTGRLEGYYPPIEAWVKYEPDPKAENVVEWGLKQVSQTTLAMTNYPLVTPDDLIVELKPNRIWKVESVTYPEKTRTILLQFLKVNAIYPSDVEHKIHVPEDRRRLLVSQMEERDRQMEF